MRRISQQGLVLIKHFEGFSAMPYDCPAGYQTIGFGHVIRDDEDFSGGIDRLWAEQLLKRDVWNAESAVQRLISAPLTQGQFDALVSFTFNLGSGALQRSTLRRKVNEELHTDAVDEFKRWVYANGRKMKGLVRRRASESLYYQCNHLMLGKLIFNHI